MLVWSALLGTLGLNVWQHKHDRPTLCSTGRRFMTPGLFLLGWGLLSAWICPHFIGGFPVKIDLNDLTD